MRLFDVFLLHCLLQDSPPDTPEEIAELKHNQHLTAERGRELACACSARAAAWVLVEWAPRCWRSARPLAAALDATHGVSDYGDALRSAQALMAAPQDTPARVLDRMARQHDQGGFRVCLPAVAPGARYLVAGPWSDAQQARYEDMARTSLAAQKAIEAADSLPFEAWRAQYMVVEGLGV